LLSPAAGEKPICRARVIKPGRQVSVVAADVFCVGDGVEKPYGNGARLDRDVQRGRCR
jgi:acyl-coenzyme A thioesterase PaaI-like protein